jgi:hypothetical protein
MTQLLELAVEAARQLSPEEQDDLARTIMEIVGGANQEVYVLSDEERAAIERSRLAYARGEVATDEQVRAVFSKYAG